MNRRIFNFYRSIVVEGLYLLSFETTMIDRLIAIKKNTLELNYFVLVLTELQQKAIDLWRS